MNTAEARARGRWLLLAGAGAAAIFVAALLLTGSDDSGPRSSPLADPRIELSAEPSGASTTELAPADAPKSTPPAPIAREITPPAGVEGRTPIVSRPRPQPFASRRILTSPPDPAGAVRGFLLREGGAWTEATVPKPGTVVLDLVSTRSTGTIAGPVSTRNPGTSLRGLISREEDGRGGFLLSFAFEDVPAGEYELTLSALGSWRWHPTTLRVVPPADGITFMRYDLDRKLPLAFHVLDRETGERIETFETRHIQLTPSERNGVFLHVGPLDPEAFPLDSRFAWSLWAEGYAPAFGDETAFEVRDGKRVAEVQLARGWSTTVLVLARDPTARQLQGAEVLVDAARAGFTAPDGTLVVSASKRPERLEVRWRGWKTVSDPLQPYLGRTAEQRGQITIVMLVP